MESASCPRNAGWDVIPPQSEPKATEMTAAGLQHVGSKAAKPMAVELWLPGFGAVEAVTAESRTAWVFQEGI